MSEQEFLGRVNDQKVIQQMRIRTAQKFYGYGDDDWSSDRLERKVRGWYEPEPTRCRYCWVIPAEPWGKCEHCGAPL